MPVNGYKKTIHTYDHTILLPLTITNNDFTANPTWPRATHIETEQIIPPANRGDIIIPAHDFPDEIHNEDSHYTRLVIGFLYTKDYNRIPIPLHDPELEALLYPDLFPDGYGHYGELKQNASSSNDKIETYGKYIKSQMLGYDPCFRLHLT